MACGFGTLVLLDGPERLLRRRAPRTPRAGQLARFRDALDTVSIYVNYAGVNVKDVMAARGRLIIASGTPCG
jgi:hypothetical protein